MRWFKYCKFLMVCCLVAVFSGCEEDDDYRGYMLSGRWFGNLGMMVDGQPAIGSDLEFIPQDYGGYTQGYGYETDYYYGWRGRVEIVEHYFTWTVRDGIITCVSIIRNLIAISVITVCLPIISRAIWMGCIHPHGLRCVTMSVIGMIMDIGVQAILTVTVPMSGVTAYKFIRRFRNV